MLTFRVRPGLKQQLRAAAERTGRSVSEEIERRLENNFYDERTQAAFLGSGLSTEALRMIRGAMVIEGVKGGDWFEDPAAAESVRTAVSTILAVLAGLPLELPENRTDGYRMAANLLWATGRRSLPPMLLRFIEE
jgi:hypothetical protein